MSRHHHLWSAFSCRLGHLPTHPIPSFITPPFYQITSGFATLPYFPPFISSFLFLPPFPPSLTRSLLGSLHWPLPPIIPPISAISSHFLHRPLPSLPPCRPFIVLLPNCARLCLLCLVASSEPTNKLRHTPLRCHDVTTRGRFPRWIPFLFTLCAKIRRLPFLHHISVFSFALRLARFGLRLGVGIILVLPNFHSFFCYPFLYIWRRCSRVGFLRCRFAAIHMVPTQQHTIQLIHAAVSAFVSTVSSFFGISV